MSDRIYYKEVAIIFNKRVILFLTLLIISGSHFYLTGWASASDKQEIEQLYQEHVMRADRDPTEMMAKWERFASASNVPELQIEAKYYIGRIITANLSADEYLSYIGQVVEGYTGDPHHLHYLQMLTTYGQVIAPPDQRETVFKRVMSLVHEGAVFPVTGRGGRSYEQMERSVLRGAVWALVHERTRAVSGREQRQAVAEQVLEELGHRPDGQLLISHARSWMQSDLRRLNETNRGIKNRGVVIQSQPIQSDTRLSNAQPPPPRLEMRVIRDPKDQGSPPIPSEPISQQDLVDRPATEGEADSSAYGVLGFLSVGIGVFLAGIGFWRIRTGGVHRKPHRIKSD